MTAETDAVRTAKRHRQFVREHLGVAYEPEKVRAIAEQAIRTAVQTKDNPADLINVALEELVRTRCELPGYTTLDEMAATIRAEVNAAFFARVSGRLYRAFRELGRVIRTVTLLRYLSDPAMRAQITAITNRAEGFHNYADWLMIGGRVLGHNDPDHQERTVKFNELLANCAVYSTALDITDAANQLAAEGHQVDTDDLATVTPYIQHTIRRMGELVLNLAPPENTPVTRLGLEPRALFPG